MKGHKIKKTESPLISSLMIIGGNNWNPDDCTNKVGLKPENIWRQPEQYIINGKRRIEWIIGFRKKEFYDTNDALLFLFDMIWEHKEKIKSFVNEQKLDLSIICNITIWKDRPLYSFSSEALKKLAWFECELVIDIFDYSEENEIND
ncbi:MAG: DUF4279 domain-containing protein [Balneolaceae bacterium]